MFIYIPTRFFPHPFSHKRNQQQGASPRHTTKRHCWPFDPMLSTCPTQNSEVQYGFRSLSHGSLLVVPGCSHSLSGTVFYLLDRNIPRACGTTASSSSCCFPECTGYRGTTSDGTTCHFTYRSHSKEACCCSEGNSWSRRPGPPRDRGSSWPC